MDYSQDGLGVVQSGQEIDHSVIGTGTYEIWILLFITDRNPLPPMGRFVLVQYICTYHFPTLMHRRSPIYSWRSKMSSCLIGTSARSPQYFDPEPAAIL